MRRSYLERFREKYGNSRLATMPSEFIIKMMDRMEPFSARNWFKCVRAVMQHAVATGLCKTDPTQGVKLPKVKSDGIRTWTDAEIAQYRAHPPLGTNARLALELAFETTQRRGDVVRMGPQHVCAGEIHLRQQKTGRELVIPITPELQAALDAAPSQHLTFLTTKTGRPYSPNDLSDQFRAWCDEAGLPQRCSIHGLRKAALTETADAGGSAHELAAQGGHRSLKEVARYTEKSDEARLSRQATARRLAARTKREGKLTNS